MRIEKHHSYSWKSILKSRSIGIKLLERKFKDERNTRLWFGPRIKGRSLVSLFGRFNLLQFGDTNLKVDSIIQNHKWNANLYPPASIFKNIIESIEIDSSIYKDCWNWKLSTKGKFSFKPT